MLYKNFISINIFFPLLSLYTLIEYMKTKSIFLFYYYPLNILFFVFCLVCIIFLLNTLKLKLVGALTSKPFAFKARSWELNSSYIIDLTNCFNDKLRVDSKGLEIVWILPWLNSNLQEEWISDKVRFSYDGLSLNRVSRFFLKKKNLLYPLVFFIIQLLDPIFLKYFEKNFNNFDFIKFKNFKSNKENIYVYMFSLFKIQYFFKNLNVNFHLNENFLFKASNFFDLNNKNLIINIKNKDSNILLNIVNQYFFFWKKILKKKTNLLKKLKKFDFLSNKNVNLIVINYFSNLFLNKKINLLLEPNFNFLLVGAMKYFNFQFSIKKNWKLKTNLFNIITINNFDFKYFKNKFSKITTLKQLKNIDTIMLININLRVTHPTFHLFLRKLVKNNDILIINLSANENLLFKHLNLGNKLFVLNKIIYGQHWLNSFLIKKKKTAFFFNFEMMSFKNLTYILNINKFLNNFFNFFNIKQKIYFLSNFYIIPFSTYNIINYLDNIDFFLSKKSLQLNSILPNNSFNSNIYISNTISNNYLNFFFSIKNTLKIKYNLYILLESNITKFKTQLWDFVFPMTNITENFLLVKNFFKKSNKSLFLKLGPWLARSFFNYLIYFFNLTIFPFLFLKKKNIFQTINFFFLNFWLESSLILIKINSDKFLKFILNNKLSFRNFFNFNKFKKNFNQISKNPWYSELSFIKSSKYSNIGYNLLKKEKTTF